MGLNYYRIKQIDYDGNGAYSDIASIRFEKTTLLTLYPTLSMGGLVYIDVVQEMDYALYASDGRRLEAGTLQPGTNTIDLSDFPIWSIFFENGSWGVQNSKVTNSILLAGFQ